MELLIVLLQEPELYCSVGQGKRAPQAITHRERL